MLRKVYPKVYATPVSSELVARLPSATALLVLTGELRPGRPRCLHRSADARLPAGDVGARGGAECTHAVTKVMRADSVPTDDRGRNTAKGSDQGASRLITPRAVNHTTNREQRQLWKPHGVGARAPHTQSSKSVTDGRPHDSSDTLGA